MDLHDVYVIEGENPNTTRLEYYQSLQRVINAGMWSLQGSYGRQMMDAINAGLCMLGEKPARDYWGNRIPARDEVVPGTKGSEKYVEEQSGHEWLCHMAQA